jgi:hypothetical protein
MRGQFNKPRKHKMKRTFKQMLGLAAFAVTTIISSFGVMAPAQAQTAPTCSNYFNGNEYPSVPMGVPNSKYLTCVPGATQARKDEIFTAVNLLPRKTSAANSNRVRDDLQQAGVTYYYFQDRAAANLWFTAHGFPSIYQTTTARCGNTVGSPTSGIITVSIFEKCTYATGVDPNPNPSLRRTTLHESGHAYAVAHAKIAGNISNSVDRSAGWKALMTNGINKLTPPQWTAGTWSSAAKASYLCQQVFLNAVPSNLERDLASTAGAVCVNGNPVDPSFAKTPRQLAEEKAPYFLKNTNGAPINNSNVELWAELFAIRHDTSASPATFLQLTDNILGYKAYNVSTGNLQCAKVVMHYFYTTNAPPSEANLATYNCPKTPGSFVTP